MSWEKWDEEHKGAGHQDSSVARRPLEQQPAPLAAQKGKFIGQKVGKNEHVFAADVEKHTAAITNGEALGDTAPVDVKVRERIKGGGIREHGIEVKSMLKGGKREISVHDDALLRKVNYKAEDPSRVVHTVVWDHRDHYEGGKHKDNYSGHGLYYKRGAGRYALSQMHKVKSTAELNRLIRMPATELPEAARGALPSGSEVEALKVRAEKAHTARLEKDRARKARIKAGRVS